MGMYCAQPVIYSTIGYLSTKLIHFLYGAGDDQFKDIVSKKTEKDN